MHKYAIYANEIKYKDQIKLKQTQTISKDNKSKRRTINLIAVSPFTHQCVSQEKNILYMSI